MATALDWLTVFAAPGAQDRPALSLDEAIIAFLEYIRSYRHCSPLTVSSYRSDLTVFRAFLGQHASPLPGPAHISRSLVLQLAVSLRHRAPQTIRRRLACLSSFFTFLQDMGYVSVHPAKRLPLPNVEVTVPVTLTTEQAQRLVAAAHRPWHSCLVVLLLATGIRRGEAARIALGDIDLENQVLLVHGKGARERVVPLNPQAVRAIEQYLPCRKATQSDRLFVSHVGQPIQGRVIGAMLKQVLVRAGLADKGITPHKLRHTFATHLIRNSVDVKTVQELLGHADLETTARYLHSDMRMKRAAVQRLRSLLEDASPGEAEAGRGLAP